MREEAKTPFLQKSVIIFSLTKLKKLELQYLLFVLFSVIVSKISSYLHRFLHPTKSCQLDTWQSYESWIKANKEILWIAVSPFALTWTNLGGGWYSDLIWVGTCHWEFKCYVYPLWTHVWHMIHIPTFQEKVNHSFTNLVFWDQIVHTWSYFLSSQKMGGGGGGVSKKWPIHVPNFIDTPEGWFCYPCLQHNPR